jgi:hypothetical protein
LKGTPSTYDDAEEGPLGLGNLLTFHCRDFSRTLRSGRPRSRREVVAEDCSCPRPPEEGICDPTYSYTMNIWEVEDEAHEEEKKRGVELGIYPERIGVFIPSDGVARIFVPPSFMNVLWDAALAADGGLRSIDLEVKRQRHRSGKATSQEKVMWAVIGISLRERIEQRKGVRAQLKLLTWSGIATVAIGVLIALWIARLWR